MASLSVGFCWHWATQDEPSPSVRDVQTLFRIIGTAERAPQNFGTVRPVVLSYAKSQAAPQIGMAGHL